MKQINLRELGKTLEETRPKSIIFRSVDQSFSALPGIIRVDMEFDSIDVAMNPNVIMLKNGSNKLFLNRVKYACVIRMSEQKSLLEITCGSKKIDDGDKVFVLVMNF